MLGCGWSIAAICIIPFTFIITYKSFFCLFKDFELIYRTRDGDVIKLNVVTNNTEVLVKNKMFESFRNQVATVFNSLINKHVYMFDRMPLLMGCNVVFFSWFQGSFKPTKYQVSPDLKYVMLAYNILPVNSSCSNL